VTTPSKQLLQLSTIPRIRTLYTWGGNYTKRELAAAATQGQEYEIPENKKFKDLREETSNLLAGFVRSKTRRAQVINEELVREILVREDWSGWRGCQIVDMNPGTCLICMGVPWSEWRLMRVNCRYRNIL